jgi:hypothetical protein
MQFDDKILKLNAALVVITDGTGFHQEYFKTNLLFFQYPHL